MWRPPGRLGLLEPRQQAGRDGGGRDPGRVGQYLDGGRRHQRDFFRGAADEDPRFAAFAARVISRFAVAA